MLACTCLFAGCSSDSTEAPSESEVQADLDAQQDMLQGEMDLPKDEAVE
jgi:hypothetical protein